MTTPRRLAALILIVTGSFLSSALAAALTAKQGQKTEYTYVRNETSGSPFKPISDANIPKAVTWNFDESQPDWKPVKPIPAGMEAVKPIRTEDALRLILTAEEHGAGEPPRLFGVIQIKLPDWCLDDWAYVEIRARTGDPWGNVSLHFNYTEENALGSMYPFQSLGDWIRFSPDGTVQTYRLSLDPSAIRNWDGFWTHLGIGFSSLRNVKTATLDILSVSIIPKIVSSEGISEATVREYAYVRNEMSDYRYSSIYDRETRIEQSFNRNAAILKTDRDPTDIVLRRVRALAADLGSAVPSMMLTRLADLENTNTSTDLSDSVSRLRLFQATVSLRDRIALCNPLLNFDKLLFIKRHHGKFSHMCDQYYGYRARHGGSIFVLDKPFSPTPILRDILKNAVVESGRLQGQKLTGSFLSPELSYDGKTIYFAHTEAAGPRNEQERRSFERIFIPLEDRDTYTEEECQPKWSPDNTFHIFKINVDGAGLRQLTDGPWNEFDPFELPNGRIIFTSERRGGYGRCHQHRCPSYTLHTMENNGSDIQCISYHESNEWHPSVNNDGMVVYTRWDYWDRGFNQAHHPWITTPDGWDPRAIQGNYGRVQKSRPLMEVDIRAIPDSHKYIATAAPHHGYAFGSLVIIDPRTEDDDAMAPLARLTPEIPFPEVEDKRRYPRHYGTPWPLSEKYHLCAFAPDGLRHGIYLIDCFGNRTLIYEDPEIRSISPMPLRARVRPPIIPPTTLAYDTSPDMSPVGVANVYDTRTPFPPGTRITHLRIIQALPKSTPIHNSPRIGYGCDKGARAVLGTVPVEKDGSAYFMLPTKKMFYFQALNEDGLAVLSMRSDIYVLPGQSLTCQGCHEPRHRTTAPRKSRPLAFSREPSVIKPDVEGSNPFSFPRLVQDVLERNCVACHDKNRAKNAPDLKKGNLTDNPWRWYTSYVNLMPFAFFYGEPPPYADLITDQYDEWTDPRTVSGHFGALESRLYKQLKKGHHDLHLSPEDMHRITLWLDCNSDFFGAYENAQAQSRGEVVHAVLE